MQKDGSNLSYKFTASLEGYRHELEFMNLINQIKGFDVLKNWEVKNKQSMVKMLFTLCCTTIFLIYFWGSLCLIASESVIFYVIAVPIM